jgi:basic membrane lipoprotein Med (substrate-binding protein (PBP1-ABC) superfamily)
VWLKVRPPWWSVIAAALAVVVLLVWVLWPADPPKREREYRAETACLLTGEKGIAAPEAAPVWAGMQEASVATRVKVQFLEVSGPQTAENAETFLASLAQSKCDLILTVGSVPVGALRATAARFPSVQFVGIGGGAAADNVSVVNVDGPDSARQKTKELVAALAA